MNGGRGGDEQREGESKRWRMRGWGDRFWMRWMSG